MPTAAVLYRDNRPGVFILDSEGRARFQPLTILARNDQWSSVEGIEVYRGLSSVPAELLSDASARCG